MLVDIRRLIVSIIYKAVFNSLLWIADYIKIAFLVDTNDIIFLKWRSVSIWGHQPQIGQAYDECFFLFYFENEENPFILT